MQEHPSLTRARKLAQATGSLAKTLGGILAHLKRTQHIRRNNTPAFGIGLDGYRRANKIKAYKEAEAYRTSEPELKRAKADAKFRRNYVARLRRQWVKLCQPIAPTLDAVIAAADTWEDRQKTLDTIQGSLAALKLTAPLLSRARCNSVANLLHIDPATARKAGASIDMRGADAHLAACFVESYGIHEPGVTHWKGGRPNSYDRATHQNFVRSFCVVESAQLLTFIIHEKRGAITAPDGYQWQRDGNGAKLVCLSDGADYHPTAADLITSDPISTCLRRLRSNAAVRESRSPDLTGLDVSDVCVCLADSLRAGNCLGGTRAFADRLQLQPAKHYPADALQRMADRLDEGTKRRLNLAIRAAVTRHKRELTAGVCLLADHTV